MDKQDIAKAIDHTLLKPEATKEQIDQLLAEAKEYEFASVCINPQWVKHAYSVLKDTKVKVCTVIGFPLGATSSEAKAFETKQAIQDGATEVDMVIAVGSLKSGEDDYVENDIRSVVNAAGNKAIVKVIIETTLLTDEEKVRACRLAKNAGAHFVKTSTGFAGGGATAADVQLMSDTVGDTMEVKASGGVKDLETMEKMMAAGATRIGASAGVAILNGLKSDTDY
ncbi:deoxyribose-phosphate aldolase [Gracilibacillus ureilyticus]|uniref:Deoxyribose-phosphate aldolase n=1 Tax=Gracilibacillus ureilyticus TaxID=531814 RepID=A0A1H9M3M2_9BACI|nr:deoxyribose-phosphate aldolase [Gracilibacillus ureilyticus]SER18097.1 deoxyribose-phosphate aldolase [Gracilibacillus ureilyticus]